MKIKPHLVGRFSAHLCAGLLLVSASRDSFATANPATWTGGDYGTSHNWSDASNWTPSNPDGSGTTIVHFSGGAGPNPNNDYGSYTQFNQILFDSGSTISFTLGGNAIKLAANGGTVAKVENNSTLLQTVSFNTGGQAIGFESAGELDPTSGDLTINNQIFVDGSGTEIISVFGGGGHTLTLNGVLENGSAVAALTDQSNNNIVINNTMTYSGDTTILAGKLEYTSAGTTNNSTIRLGSTSGTTAAEIDLITATGGVNMGSVINPVTTSGTGTDTLNSQNTSGTNTLSNHIGLDRSFTITQSAGTGALNITQARSGVTTNTGFDIKGFTATFTPGAGGTINDSGDIYNSVNNGTVVMNGAGTLALSGNNTYSGATTLSSGTLDINSTTAIGATAATLTINGGTIDNTTAGALTLANNNAVVWVGDFAFGGTQNLNMGTGAVTMGASRTITLGGTNSTLTFGGTVTNTSGASPTLTVNGAGNTLSLGAFNLANSATNRTLTVAGTGNVAITGVVANGSTSTASKIIEASTGTLTLSGASTFGGGLTLNSGTLALGADSTGSITNGPVGTGTLTLTNTGTGIAVQSVGATHTVNNAVAITTAATINGSQSLTLGGTWTETNSITLTNNIAAGKTFTLGAYNLSSSSTARTLTVAGTGNTTFAGSITGGGTASGNLDITNTGTTILSAANSYAGTSGDGTTLGTIGGANAGTLQLVGAGTLGATTNVLIDRGGTVDLNGTTQTISTLTLGNGAAGSNASVTLGGGTLNLGGTVTYSVTGGNTPNGATISGAGAVSLNGTQIFSVSDSTAAATDLTVSSVIQNGSSTSGLTKQGAGTMALTGTASNTYTGLTTVTGGELDLNKTGAQAMGGNLTIGGGTVVWDQNNQLATSSFVTINSGTLNLNGQTQTVMDLKNLGGTFMTGAGSWTGTSNSMTWGASSVANTINTGGSVTDIHITVAGGSNTIQNGGVLNVSPAGTGLEMDGGTITLNADPTSPGKISLMSNVVADDGTTSSINTSSATNAGVIDLNGATRTFTVGSSNAATTLNVSANIVGTNGGVTSAGPGSLVLTGNNTYTGATTVSAGTLNAGATGALGSTSNVTVGSSGTLLLSGSGNLNRVNDAAGISLGGGTFARTGTASEGTGATIVNGSATGGSNTTGLGALTLTATSNLDFGSSGVGTLVFASFTPSGNILNILNYTNTNANFALNNSGVDGTDDRLIFATDQSGNLGDFNFGGGITAEEIALGGGYFEITGISAVPEPGTWVAAGLALATLLYSQRRRFVRHR